MGMNFLLQNSFSEKYMFHVPVDHPQNPYFSTTVMKFSEKSTVSIRVIIGLHNALLVVMATINKWEDLWKRLQNQRPCDTVNVA